MHGTKTGDRIDNRQGTMFANSSQHRFYVLDNASGGFVVSDDHGFKLPLAVGVQSFLERSYRNGLTWGRREPLDFGTQRFRHARPALAKDTADQTEDGIARADGIEDTHFQSGRARSGEDEHITFCLPQPLQVFADVLESLRKIRGPVPDRMPGDGFQNRVGNWGRAGNHQKLAWLQCAHGYPR